MPIELRPVSKNNRMKIPRRKEKGVSPIKELYWLAISQTKSAAIRI
jgi:hypothetical protein